MTLEAIPGLKGREALRMCGIMNITNWSPTWVVSICGDVVQTLDDRPPSKQIMFTLEAWCGSCKDLQIKKTKSNRVLP
jgi:hypothetical protein